MSDQAVQVQVDAALAGTLLVVTGDRGAGWCDVNLGPPLLALREVLQRLIARKIGPTANGFYLIKVPAKAQAILWADPEFQRLVQRPPSNEPNALGVVFTCLLLPAR